MARNDGWIPQQHGAWVMLLVPSLLGLISALWQPELSGPDLLSGQFFGRLFLVLAFITGYFVFNAATLWLKAAAVRRRQLLAPLLVYALIALILAMTSTWFLGVALWWWGLVYAPMAGPAFILVAIGEERSLLSGALTVAAASLFHTVVVHPTWLTHPSFSVAAVALWVSLLCFLYFFGTVWTVKTMIRRRGSMPWWLGSMGYHVAALAISLAGWGISALPLVYPLFFLLCVVKSWLLPKLGPMAKPPRRVTPVTLGLVELVFSLFLTTMVVGWPPLEQVIGAG